MLVSKGIKKMEECKMLSIIIAIMNVLMGKIVSKAVKAMKQITTGLYVQYNTELCNENYIWYLARKKHAKLYRHDPKRAYKKALKTLEKEAERRAEIETRIRINRMLGKYYNDDKNVRHLIRLFNSKYHKESIPDDLMTIGYQVLNYLRNEGNKMYEQTRNAKIGCAAILTIMGVIDIGNFESDAKDGKIVINKEALEKISDVTLKNNLDKVLSGEKLTSVYNGYTKGRQTAVWSNMLNALRKYVKYIDHDVVVTKECVPVISLAENAFYTWKKNEEGKNVPVLNTIEIDGQTYCYVQLNDENGESRVVSRGNVNEYKEQHNGREPYFIVDNASSSVLARKVFNISKDNLILTVKPQNKSSEATQSLMEKILDNGFYDASTGTLFKFLAMPASKMKTCQFVFTSIPVAWVNNPNAYIGYVWGMAMGLTKYANVFRKYHNDTKHIVTMDEVVNTFRNEEFQGYRLVNENGLVNVAKTWSRFGLAMSSTFSLMELVTKNPEMKDVYDKSIGVAKTLRVKDASVRVKSPFHVISGIFNIHKPLTTKQMEENTRKRFDKLVAFCDRESEIINVPSIKDNLNKAKELFADNKTDECVNTLEAIVADVKKQIEYEYAIVEEYNRSGKKLVDEIGMFAENVGTLALLSDKIKDLKLDIKNGIAGEDEKTLTPGDGEMLANIKIIAGIATLLKKITIDEYKIIMDWWNSSDKILANIEEDSEIRNIIAKIPPAYTIRHGGKKGLLKLADLGQLLDTKKNGEIIVDNYDILTPDSAEKFSVENWEDAEFSVCLVGKVHSDKDFINTNAFMLSALKLSPKQIVSIAKTIIDEMVDALKDPDKAVAFFAKYSDDFNCQNGPASLLAMNKKLIKMDIVQTAILTTIKVVINNMACGRMKVPGNTSFISCDWAELLNLWLKDEMAEAGVHIKTLDEYAKEQGINEGYKGHYSNKSCEAMIARSPGYGWQEIVKLTLVKIDAWWWNHDVCELSVFDGIWENLQGADFDGDKIHLIFNNNPVGKMFVDAIRHGTKLINKRNLANLISIYLTEPGVIVEAKKKKEFTWKAITAMLIGTLNGDMVGLLSKSAMTAIDLANELIILSEMSSLTGYKVKFYNKFDQEKFYMGRLGHKGEKMFVSDRFNNPESAGLEVPCDENIGKPIDPRLTVNGDYIQNELTAEERKALGDLFDVDGDKRLYTGWFIGTCNGEKFIYVEAPTLGNRLPAIDKNSGMTKTEKIMIHGREKSVKVFSYTRKTWSFIADISRMGKDEVENGYYYEKLVKGETMLAEDNNILAGTKTAEELEDIAVEFAKLGIVNGCECGREIDRTKNGFGHVWGLLINAIAAHRVYSDWMRKGQCNELLVRNQYISTSTLGVLYQYVQAREKEIDKIMGNGIKMVPYVATLLNKDEYDGVWKIIKSNGGTNKGYTVTKLEVIRNSYLNEIRGVDINENPELIECAQKAACRRIIEMCDELNVPYTSAAVAAFFMGTKEKTVGSFSWLLADELAEVLKRDPDARRIIKLPCREVISLKVESDNWLIATIPAYKVNRKDGKKKVKIGTKEFPIEQLDGVAQGEIPNEDIFQMGDCNFAAIPWKNNSGDTLITDNIAPRFNIIGKDKTKEEIGAIANALFNKADGVLTKIIVDEEGKIVGLMDLGDKNIVTIEIDTYSLPKSFTGTNYKAVATGLEIATFVGKTFRSYGVNKETEAYKGEKCKTSITAGNNIVNVFVR